jgi:hypothetical protein
MLVPEQINLYIAEQPEWQRKLLVRLRQLIHAVDESIVEAWRWNTPHFDHEGAIMLGMGVHKNHVSVMFHKGALIKDPKKLFEEVTEEKGTRIIKFSEGDAIAEAAFSDLVKKAVALNTKGTKLGDAKPERRALEVPPELEAVLKKDPTAWANWQAFSYSHKKEYAEWIADGKKEETRKRRIAQALEMIREGVGKEDKYRLKGA